MCQRPGFFYAMTQLKQQALTSLPGSKAAAYELPIIQQGDNILISAHLLHKKLKVNTRFYDWIKRRVEKYGFQEGLDYYSNLSNRSDGKAGRQLTDYLLTLDTAKELAMLEENETGRSIRRYFIQKEKELRAVSQLPKEGSLFKGLKPRRINDRVLYPYREVLVRAGYKANNNGNRRQRYWMHFVKEGTVLYVTEEFALHLYRQRQVLNNRAVMKACQPVLALPFYDTPNQKGGAL